MSEPTIGHNGQLKALTERINRMEDDKKTINEDIREIYVEAKNAGFNPKALRAVVRRQRQDAKELAQFEADVALYMRDLGMGGPL